MEIESTLNEAWSRAIILVNEAAAAAAEIVETGTAMLVARFPMFPDYLPHIFELCVLCLAMAVFLLCRRVRRDHYALRALAAELDQHRTRFAGVDRLQGEMVSRLAVLRGDLADLTVRQRGMEARVGKPDTKLAVAMARAGTRRQHMVECGLSHGEVHLLHALNSTNAAATPHQATGAQASLA